VQPVARDPEAVLNLISSILQDRGPLPVGEIGKRLQEATSPELSLYLKETHGGLKKVDPLPTHSLPFKVFLPSLIIESVVSLVSRKGSTRIASGLRP
jgi:hypothetical protein